MDNFQKETRKSVKNIVQIVHPTLTISNSALKVMQAILAQLNKEIIAACKKGPKMGGKKTSDKDSGMEVQVVRNAVNRILPAKLRKFATAEAIKSLSKHSAGLLAYTPGQSKKSMPKQQSGVQMMMRSVPGIMNLTGPNLKMQRDAKELVADVMQQMCKTVVEKARESADAHGGDTLRPQDVIKAVQQVMGPVMAQHAIAEGARVTMMYANVHYQKGTQEGQEENDTWLAAIAEALGRNS